LLSEFDFERKRIYGPINPKLFAAFLIKGRQMLQGKRKLNGRMITSYALRDLTEAK
jgi:hypothetical protein